MMDATLHLVAFLLLGTVLGGGYYWLLFVEVGQYTRGVPARYAIVTHVLRLAAAVVMFWLIAQYGAVPLVAALAGFTVVLALLKPLTAP
jgi:hypothetical protein